MPRKAHTGRNTSAHRSRQKAAKSFELVQPERTDADQDKLEASEEISTKATSTSTDLPANEEKSTSSNGTTKGSAASRIAARRRMAQQAQQRQAASVVSAEHFTYVQNDLKIIAILSILMLAIIFVFYFLIGR